MVYPTGQVVEYLPSATDVGLIGAVRLNAGSGFATLAQNLAYKPFGPLSAMTLGNNIQQTKGFDQNYQIAAITAGTVMSRTYTPDNAGNIATITDHLSAARTQTFGYDALNRLTTATGIHGTQGFAYDHTGNRRTATDDGIQDIYSFVPGTNRLDTISGSQTINFDHDSRGNLIGRTYVTGSGPTGTQNPDYTYTHDGQRITKAIGTQTTVYHYDLYGQLIAETTTSGDPIKAYIYLHNEPLAQIGPTGTVSYYHNDHLGTPQRMTNAGGTLVWSADYLPFGQADVTVATIENNLRFPGQYYDTETGLHYNYWRYYDPTLGRYLRADPIGLAGGINPFVYVSNNPLFLLDPYGLDWLDTAANYSAGFGDTITLGGTAWIRSQWTQNIWGGIDAVDQCSSDYGAGKWSGYAWDAGMALYLGAAAAPYVVEGIAASVEYTFTAAYVGYWTAGAATSTLTATYGAYILPAMEAIESANPGMMPPHFTIPGILGWGAGTVIESSTK